MGKRITARRNKPVRTTVLTATGPLAEIQLRVTARLCPRQRRDIAIRFFRQVRPWLAMLENTRIHHLEDDRYNFERERVTGVRLFKYRKLDSPSAAIGFKIRIQRLELGYTLQDLADKAGINAGHLSEIERGLFSPSLQLRKKLEAALGLPGFLEVG
jgi:DNA-binding XRE family transcriptional regulator